MNIVVLAGGLSTERDVSLSSGCMVCNALRKKGHHAVLLDVFLGMPDMPKDVMQVFNINPAEELPGISVQNLVPDLNAVRSKREDKSDCYLGPGVIELCQKADMVYMALHGDNGENGELQATFNTLGIRYTGTGCLGSAIAMNKGLTKQVFLNMGIPTADGVILTEENRDQPLSSFGLKLPVVVKPCSGGSSVGVSIPDTEDEYQRAIDDAFRYENEVVVETYIKAREFSISVLDGRALPVIEIIPKSGFYDYVNKYQAGRTLEICPAELPEKTAQKMQRLAEQVYKVLKLQVYARADFLLTPDGLMYCMEANTLPGMTPTSLLPQEAAADGICYEDLCEQIIQISMKKYQ